MFPSLFDILLIAFVLGLLSLGSVGLASLWRSVKSLFEIHGVAAPADRPIPRPDHHLSAWENEGGAAAPRVDASGPSSRGLGGPSSSDKP